MNWQVRADLSSAKSRAKTWKGANNRWVKKILMAGAEIEYKIYQSYNPISFSLSPITSEPILHSPMVHYLNHSVIRTLGALLISCLASLPSSQHGKFPRSEEHAQRSACVVVASKLNCSQIWYFSNVTHNPTLKHWFLLSFHHDLNFHVKLFLCHF